MGRPAVFAWVLALLSAALWLAHAALAAVTPDVGYFAPSAHVDLVYALDFLGSAVIGALIVTRQPRLSIGWMLVVAGILSNAHMLALRYGMTLRELTRLPVPDAIVWVNNWAYWAPVVLVTTLLPLHFPTGRASSARIARAVIATSVLLVAWPMIQPGPANGPFDDVPNPLGFEPLLGVARGITLATQLGWGLAMVATVVAVVARFRGARGTERQQLKWVVSALAAQGILFSALIGLELTGIAPWDSWHPLARVIVPLVFALVPVAAGIAILRYRLYEIDVIIRRTLVYGALSLALVATYVGLVILVQAVLRPFTAGSELAVAGSTLATLALVQPLLRWIRGFVDHRFYRSRYDAARTLDAFTARLRNEVELEAVRTDLLGVVGDTVRPAHASVWLRHAGR